MSDKEVILVADRVRVKEMPDFSKDVIWKHVCYTSEAIEKPCRIYLTVSKPLTLPTVYIPKVFRIAV